jgi:hypothetical protein
MYHQLFGVMLDCTFLLVRSQAKLMPFIDLELP